MLKSLRCGITQTGIEVLALPLTGSVILVELLNLFKCQFPSANRIIVAPNTSGSCETE